MIVAGLFCLALAQHALTPEPEPPATTVVAPEPTSCDLPSVVASWREALELDLPAEVLTEGPELVTPPAGPLHEDGEAVALVALALYATGGEEGALHLLDRAEVRAETRAYIDIAVAEIQLERDQLQRVVTLLRPQAEGAPTRYPEHPKSYLLLARALSRGGKPERADPLLQRFTSLAPLDREAPSAWHMLAQHAIARRELETARAYRLQAEESGRWQAYYRARRLQIRENPKAPLPRLGLAKLWLAVAEHGKARDVCVELVRLAPDFCRGWTLLGESERALGTYDRARKALDRALECDPKSLEARLQRGALARIQGRLDDARVDLELVVADEGSHTGALVRAHLELARTLAALGEEQRASERYAKYIELGGKEALDPR